MAKKIKTEVKTLDEIKKDFLVKSKKDGYLHQDNVDQALEHLDLNDQESEDLLSWFEQNNIKIEDGLDDDAAPDVAIIGNDDKADKEAELELIDEIDEIEDIDDEDSDDEDEKTIANDLDTLEREYANKSTNKINDPVKMYLKEIGRVELLDPKEEPEIAQKIQEGYDAKSILEVIDVPTTDLEVEKITELQNIIDTDKNTGTETEIFVTENSEFVINMANKYFSGESLSEEEKENLEKVVKVGDKAKQKLITANLRLVVSIAKKYVGRGMLFLDLIQEGNIGLAKAVEKFDYTKGFKFSTYATWWIRQAITRAIADQARTIRIPVHMVETINKLTRIQRQLVQDLGRDPSAEEISAQMEGISPEKVREIQKIALDPVSLETPIGEEDDSHLGDFIEDKDALSPDEYANNQLLKDEINEVLQGLTEREEKVLRLRFGLLDGRTRTLEEVGKEFNVTRERIRQIEAKALRKLKHPNRSRRLEDFMDRK